MSKKYIRVALDAMGGDLAPAEPVKAAVEALEKRKILHMTEDPSYDSGRQGGSYPC